MINNQGSLNFLCWESPPLYSLYALEKLCLEGNLTQLRILIGHPSAPLKLLCEELLNSAIEAGQLEIIDYLLSLEIDPCQCREFFIPPVLKALEQNNERIIEKIFSRINLLDVSISTRTCLMQYPCLIPLFIKKGWNVYSTKSGDFKPLNYLCAQGKVDLLIQVFKNYPSFEVPKLIAHEGLMAIAIFYEQKTVVNLFLNKYQNVNTSDAYGMMPLMLAAEFSFDLVMFFLDKGAFIHHLDLFGRSALFYACRGGKEESVRELLHRGCSIEGVDVYQYSPFRIAQENGHKKVMILLLERMKGPAEKEENLLKDIREKVGCEVRGQKLIAHAWALKGTFFLAQQPISYEGGNISIMLQAFKRSVGEFLDSKVCAEVFEKEERRLNSKSSPPFPDLNDNKENIPYYVPPQKKCFSILDECRRGETKKHESMEDLFNILKTETLLFLNNIVVSPPKDLQKIVEKIKKNFPVYLPSGWNEKKACHSTGILFFEGLHKINRGEGSKGPYSSVGYTYAKDKLTPDVIQNILKGSFHEQLWSRDYFLKKIDTFLRLRKGPSVPLPQQTQKVGNCVWSTLQGAFFTFLQLIAKKHQISSLKVKEFYKCWNAFADAWVIIEYLQYSQDPNPQLLAEVYAKALLKPERNAKTIQALEEYFQTFLDRVVKE